MKSILKYVILTAIRDWLFVGLFISLTIAFGISSLLGSIALVERAETSLVYIAGSSRMIFVIGIILFVCFYIRKSFENKEVDFILSKSISRNKIILSYLLGFTLIASIILVPIAIILLFSHINKIGLLYWLISIIFEISIIINFAILTSLILKSAISSILASLGFYIISRMMAFFVLTVQIPKSLSNINDFNSFLELILKILSIVFPRIDLFTKSDWLIYGVANAHMTTILIQSLIYIPLLIFMSFYDFNKKQF